MFFFLSIGPKINLRHCCAGENKFDAQLTIRCSQSDVKMVPIGSIQQSDNLNAQSTVFTNNNVLVTSGLWGMDKPTPRKHHFSYVYHWMH